jgi:hypothetical protein
MMGAQAYIPAGEISFTYCKNFATAETKRATWAQFAAAAMKSVGYDTKEESIRRAAIVGGVRSDESVGRADNVKTRTILTLDYDDFDTGVTLDDIELAIEMSLPDCAWVAYSTFRHTPEAPRIRIMAPLSREVGPAEYVALVDVVAAMLDLSGLDACSKVINQIMFLASHKNGINPWARVGGSGALNVDDMGLIVRAVEPAGDVFDLDLAIASEPLDISPDQIAALLDNYPAQPLGYEEWFRVGMALHHQHSGSDNGLAIWSAWCARDADRYKPNELPKKWRSFGGSGSPVTMASVIKAAGGIKGGAIAISAASGVATTLREDAEAVADMIAYGAFKKRVQAMSAAQMPPDIRSMLATTVHEVFAKGAGMGLREVKASFKPAKGGARGDDEQVTKISAPEWLDGWVYDEANCLFTHSKIANYGIKKEAFRARYDRMHECADMETDAATLALNFVQIPTVAQSMYWPSQDRFFETMGKDCLNSYFSSGIPPLAPGALADDADGESVVQLFLNHVAMLIDNEREQGILLDWLSYVYQNPGRRVHWAMLLWGIEGNGKSYFFNIMRTLMGENAKEISTSMIERPFNDWAVGSVLSCVEEIRISGTNKWAILDKIKPMLTNDTIAVEPKGRAAYSAPNFASYLMLTNHQDAIPVSNNDRRYCVIFTKQAEEADLFEALGGRDGVADYFGKLFSESARRADAIGRWLLDRKQGPDFHPAGRAPITRGLADMREANVSDDQNILREAIADYACTVVSSTVIDVTHLSARVLMDGDEQIPTGRKIGQMLRDLGYSPVTSKCFLIKRKKHYVWVKRNKVTDDQAKEIVRSYHAGDDDFEDVPF